MPKVEDLMAFGMDSRTAQLLGNTTTTIAAAGSTAAAGTTIQPGTNVVLCSFSSSTAAAATLSTAWSLGTPIYLCNIGTVTGTVFPPVNATLNGTSNGSFTLTTGAAALFIQTTAGFWRTIPTANQ